MYFLLRDDIGLHLARASEDLNSAETIALLYPAASLSPGMEVELVTGATSLFIIIDDRYRGNSIGTTLWHYSPAQNTVTKVYDLQVGAFDVAESMFIKDDLFYFRNGPSDNVELWRSDGTPAGTGLYLDINSGASSYPNRPRRLGDEVWFDANDGPARNLFRMQGNDAITKVSVDILNAIDSFPRQFTPLKSGITLFKERNGLHSTRGTPETTTEPLVNIVACSRCDYERLFPIGNGALLWNPSTGYLWYTDGSDGPEGIEFVQDNLLPLYPETKNTFARLNTNTALFFAKVPNVDSAYTRNLWRANGSNEGTTLVKTLSLPTPSSAEIALDEIETLVSHRRVVYFMGTDPQHGNELWRTDGTESGTYMVKELVPGTGEMIIQNLTSAQRNLYFTYADARGLHLAKSRGSANDTMRIASLPANIAAIQDVTAVNDSVFLRSGRNLYKSRGHAGDLRRIGQFGFTSQVDSSYGQEATVTTDGPAAMTAFGNHLYFIARKNAADPLQVWRAIENRTKVEVVAARFNVHASDAKDVDFYVHGNRLFLTVMDRVGRHGGIFELRARGNNLQWVRHTNMGARELQIAGDKMYFAGFDDEFGEEPRVIILPKKP